MSDFLTNLVMRSFSGAPSVQPMTNAAHFAYAAPEALPEPAVESSEQHVNKPAVTSTYTAPVTTVTEFNNPSTPLDSLTPVDPLTPIDSLTPVESLTPVDPVVVPQIKTKAFVPETFESEQSVLPIPDNTIAKPRIKTELQPAKRIFQTQIERHEPIASSNPVIKHETLAEPEHELEIVEHVIEHSSVAAPIERQITRPVTRKLTRQVERPVTRQITSENTTEKTIENTHTIEHTQQQQQLTSSFTTLIPNTPPRILPTIKSRPHTPVPVLPSDAEQPAPQPETVINVAIGRIEVRATPASIPKRERQQDGPKIMTLDDYVQKRSRGAQ